VDGFAGEFRTVRGYQDADIHQLLLDRVFL
jgi:hypothetical protein